MKCVSKSCPILEELRSGDCKNITHNLYHFHHQWRRSYARRDHTHCRIKVISEKDFGSMIHPSEETKHKEMNASNTITLVLLVFPLICHLDLTYLLFICQQKCVYLGFHSATCLLWECEWTLAMFSAERSPLLENMLFLSGEKDRPCAHSCSNGRSSQLFHLEHAFLNGTTTV